VNRAFALLLPLLAACSMFGSSAPEITQQELLALIHSNADILLLDVRTPGEFAEGHIPGAFHLDHRDIESRAGEIEAFRNKPVIVYCYSGARAGMVESYLIEHGFSQVKHLQGDWRAWEEKGLPSETVKP